MAFNRETLITLLKTNPIDPAAIDAQMQELQNEKLTSLNLEGTWINTPEALAALVEGLKKNTTLISLDLGINAIDDDCTPSLITLLQENPRITSLKLDNNFLSEESLAAIQQQLNTNSSNKALDVFMQWSQRPKTPLAFGESGEMPATAIGAFTQAVLDDRDLPTTRDKLAHAGELRTVNKSWAETIHLPTQADVKGRAAQLQ